MSSNRMRRARVVPIVQYALVLLAAGSVLLFAPRVRADPEACVAAHEQGQELRIQGRLGAARERFASCARNCPKVVQKDCASLLAQVEESLPSIVFAVSDEQGSDLPSARVLSNGQLLSERTDGRVVTLDPGSYRIRVEADGHAPLERQLVVNVGEKRRVLRMQLERARAELAVGSARPGTEAGGAGSGEASEAVPSSESVHVVPLTSYVLGGAALATVAAAVVLGALGKKELDRLEQRCEPDGCGRDQTRRGRNLYIAADVGFGVAGGLALAATGVLVAKLLRGERADRQARLGPWLDRQSAGLVLQRAF